VLVPTRELAIQVAEAFQKYASHMPGLHVLPIYGGQSYTPQLNALRRGVHVIVATPGRVMDHLQRETLSLSTIRFVVLDEADEMLRWASSTPSTRSWASCRPSGRSRCSCAMRLICAGSVAETGSSTASR
jgi:superfamily II DNA/RNA helicase